MIKSKKGKVILKGKATELCAELSMICRNLKKVFAEELPEHIAKELVMSAAEIGLKSEEELHNAVQDIIKRLFNEEGENNEESK